MSNKIEADLRTSWACPEETDARILGGPNVPKPLQGFGHQPRTILGSTVWDSMRKRGYYKANYKCQICGADCSKPGSMDCLERGTEVLTTFGWKPIESVTLDDYVAQFEPKTETISFVHPNKVIEKYAAELISIGYKSGFSMSLTENHRVLLRNKHTKQWETLLAKDVPVGRYKYSIPTAGKGGGSERLSVDERIFIALQADGYLQHRRKSDGMYHFIISVKKPRKKKQLAALMHDTTFSHSEISTKANIGYLTYSIDVPVNCKFFSNAFEYKMSYGKAVDFLDELVKWDGWTGSRKNAKRIQQNCRCYYSSSKENIDFVQAVAAQASFGTHCTFSYRGVNSRKSYNLEIKKKSEHGTQTMQKKKIKYNDSAFCLTVPTHYFVARNKDGDVFITGNCHELYTIDYKAGTSTFKRGIAICKTCHSFYHSGRLITLHKQGIPFYGKKQVLGTVEHGFKLINEWNKAHPDEPKLKAFATFLDYLKVDDLASEMEELIKKYDIEFWGVDSKSFAEWGDWKLIMGNKEYPTRYKDYHDWEEAMEEMSKNDYERSASNPFTGGVFDEINKILKGEKDE